MITKKQLKDLQVKVQAASAAMLALYEEIDDEGYMDSYQEATEKQQGTPKYDLLSQVSEVRDFDWTDTLDGIDYAIEQLLEPTEV